MEFEYCKLEIFIPESHLDKLRQALVSVDAGHIGNYDSCMSYHKVTGSWRALEGTNPYMGSENQLCTAEELKVEVTCKTKMVEKTIKEIKKIHPYEEPVINAIPLYKTGLGE